LQQAFRADAMAKPLHAGQAAETGVMVALAAEKGVTGAPDILDGERGFGAAMAQNPDWRAAADDLGRSYTILRTTLKAHAACGHAHAAIDGILALKDEHALAPESVATIRVGTYAKALEITGNKAPRTAFEAKFSLPYCVSVALLTGRVRLDAFSKERLADGRLRALMDKVELRVEPEIEAAFPGHRAATVEIGTVDGRRFTHHAPTRKGDPDNPLSDGELEDKFRELTAPVIGEAAAARLLETLWRVEAFDDMAELSVAGPDLAGGAQA
jgi:2-methylcitrate dehydratase PrpD